MQPIAWLRILYRERVLIPGYVKLPPSTVGVGGPLIPKIDAGLAARGRALYVRVAAELHGVQTHHCDDHQRQADGKNPSHPAGHDALTGFDRREHRCSLGLIRLIDWSVFRVWLVHRRSPRNSHEFKTRREGRQLPQLRGRGVEQIVLLIVVLRQSGDLA